MSILFMFFFVSTWFTGQSLNYTLIPFEYNILPINTIKTHGWLKKQLEIQAEGLSGYLSLFWEDVANSTWIGGPGDGGLHERAPYWLNGMVPLSILLQDDNLLQQSSKYVEYIFDHQDANGWLGPDDISDGNMYWARFNVLNSFRMYIDGFPEMSDQIKTSMLKYILQQKERMYSIPLQEWSAARYMDFILSVHWLIDNGGDIINGYENDLYEVCYLAYNQGLDWEYWFDHLPTEPVSPDNTTMYTHGVNNAQALKSAAVIYRQTGNETLRILSFTRVDNLDEYHGQATGMFAADEHLAGRNPSRGTELCDVVEAMFSYAIMFEVFGDIKYLDRLELISMNALPATFASPAGGDMWAHQYLQQVNEINAIYTDPHVWATDGPNSTTYGLEPNYGCCTANFNQGWPKYTFSIFYYTSNNDAVIGIYAPASMKFPSNIGGGAFINISTAYPFEDDINLYINCTSSFNLLLRIPSWSHNSTIIVNNKQINTNTIINGTFQSILINKGESNIYINFNPKFRIYQGFNNSVSLLRGSLLFSYMLGEMFEITAVYPYQSRDYQVWPQSDWAFALIINDLNNIEKSLTLEQPGYLPQHAPFNRTNIPIYAWINAAQANNWGEFENAASSPPLSPVCVSDSEDNNSNNNDIDTEKTSLKTQNCGDTISIRLVPHGCTDLRIGEFPLAYNQV